MAMIWSYRAEQKSTETAIFAIQDYFSDTARTDTEGDAAFIQEQLEQIQRTDRLNTLLVSGLFVMALGAMTRDDAEDLMLEITESAYTGDSEQVISTARELRGMGMGFRIEMDDFGTGYSSLGMLSQLPIDALKLDMSFIRSAFGEKRDMRMIELIIDIADYLRVPVVAEGVETEEQYLVLKAMGCDLVQGYYFSKPVPPEEFDRFLLERGKISVPESVAKKSGISARAASLRSAPAARTSAATSGISSSTISAGRICPLSKPSSAVKGSKDARGRTRAFLCFSA